MLANYETHDTNVINMFVSERDIDALLDNELSHEKEKRVYSTLEETPHLKSYYKTMLSQKKAVQLWWEQMGKLQN